MIDPTVYARLDALLEPDDVERARRYPGAQPGRQPVHTVYISADRFRASTVGDWSAQALAVLDKCGPPPGCDGALETRVRAKLSAEPIEDLRIDFEDGYGTQSDETEDASARHAANALAESSGTSFVGIRMKSLEGPTRHRGIRTLDVFLQTLLTRGTLPPGFRVTLPKVTSARQVEAMGELCAAVEHTYSLPMLPFEIQIETPQAILGADGTALVARMLQAAAGRCVGLHYGTYDYSAALGIAAPYQSMEHPVADHAKAVMQVAAAGTGTPVCDGSTNVLPQGDREAVQAAWALHARLVRRSLERGFYQGWDLHPAQLPTRFATTFAFYRAHATAAVERLSAYLARRESGFLDEPATVRALAGLLHRGLQCGALDETDLGGHGDLTVERIRVLA